MSISLSKPVHIIMIVIFSTLSGFTVDAAAQVSGEHVEIDDLGVDDIETLVIRTPPPKYIPPSRPIITPPKSSTQNEDALSVINCLSAIFGGNEAGMASCDNKPASPPPSRACVGDVYGTLGGSGKCADPANVPRPAQQKQRSFTGEGPCSSRYDKGSYGRAYNSLPCAQYIKKQQRAECPGYGSIQGESCAYRVERRIKYKKP